MAKQGALGGSGWSTPEYPETAAANARIVDNENRGAGSGGGGGGPAGAFPARANVICRHQSVGKLMHAVLICFEFCIQVLPVCAHLAGSQAEMYLGLFLRQYSAALR